MLINVAKALNQVHKVGHLHCNIAPWNMLCNQTGNVQLVDFGLAKYIGFGIANDSDGTAQDDPILDCKKCLMPDHQHALAWWAPKTQVRMGNDVPCFALHPMCALSVH